MNLLLHNEDFAPLIWPADKCSIVAAAGSVPPSGPAAASAQLKEDGSNARHGISTTAVSRWTDIVLVSIYAKAGTRAYITFYLDFGGNHDIWAFYKLSDGTLGACGGSTSSDAHGSGIESIGSSWFRCSMLLGYRPAAGTQASLTIQSSAVDASSIYQGVNGDVSLEIAGAVLESAANYYRT